MRTDQKHIDEALLTPTTPKHIEEARRFADHICLDTERDVVVQKLATLLAAQEELETLRKAGAQIVESGEQILKDYGKTALEVEQLRAELEKWKLGCETNADCYRTAVRAQDEQRLELVKLRTHNAALMAVLNAAKEHLHLWHTRNQTSLHDVVTAYDKCGFEKKAP